MQKIHNQRGAVLVFVTLMIVLLMIMVGMGLDTGHLTFVRSQGQGAVDAAALSAVSGLANGGTQAEIEARATSFVATNNYVGSPANALTGANVSPVLYNSTSGAITNSSYGAANAVRVALEKKNPYTTTTVNKEIKTPLFLMPLMNLFGSSRPGTSDINVSAVAALTAKPSLPIAVFDTTCNLGDINSTVTVPNVRIRQSSAPADNSCWTSYLINPPSASTIAGLFQSTATCTGMPAGNITVGTPININNGQQNSDYDDALKLFSPYSSSKCWFVPIVTKNTSCNQAAPILGWAKICPTNVVKTGNPKYIEADVSCGQNLYNTSGALCFKPRLVRETKVGM